MNDKKALETLIERVDNLVSFKLCYTYKKVGNKNSLGYMDGILDVYYNFAYNIADSELGCSTVQDAIDSLNDDIIYYSGKRGAFYRGYCKEGLRLIETLQKFAFEYQLTCDECIKHVYSTITCEQFNILKEVSKENNVFIVSKNLMHKINDDIETFKALNKTYEKVGDIENADRCFDSLLILAKLSDHIDSYIDRHDCTIYDTLCSNSFIWHMQSRIGRMIDTIMVNGYHYVMRDSVKLKAQFRALESIYDYIFIIAKEHDVYV